MGNPDEGASTCLNGDALSLSTSLSEARQLYTLLSDIEFKLDSTNVKAHQATLSYADLYNVLQDVFMILRRAGLPEDVTAGIMLLQRMIITLNAARVALIALQAATGPLGLASAGLGVAISLTSFMGSIG